MIVWIGVALLGGVGACARFLVDKTFATRAWPRGTMVVNLRMTPGPGRHHEHLSTIVNTGAPS